MRCIGMGDINAVDLAEETHLELLKDHAALFRPGLLSWGEEFPRQNVLRGVYIDAGPVIGIVDIDGLGKEAAESKLAESCISALEQENSRFLGRTTLESWAWAARSEDLLETSLSRLGAPMYRGAAAALR